MSRNKTNSPLKQLYICLSYKGRLLTNNGSIL
ncbi:unknown [Prevotella sp. CAG:255]|nr:unknown [Prevotella sp. CAG:255]